MEANDAKTAREQLNWVLEHASEPGLKAVARLRLATLAVDGKQYDEALGLLGGEHDTAFDGLFLDAKGDALAAKGDTAGARSAYREALNKTRLMRRTDPIFKSSLMRWEANLDEHARRSAPCGDRSRTGRHVWRLLDRHRMVYRQRQCPKPTRCKPFRIT